MSTKRLVCPDCNKRGVTLRLSTFDWWGCRYCSWFAYTGGDYESDARERVRLQQANPDHEIVGT